MPLERLAVDRPNGIRVVTKLTHSEECPAILVVTEGRLLIDHLLSRDSYLELMLRASICDDFPVMDALVELDIRIDCSEQVVVFHEVQRPLVFCHLYFLWKSGLVPRKLLDNDADNLSLELAIF